MSGIVLARRGGSWIAIIAASVLALSLGACRASGTAVPTATAAPPTVTRVPTPSPVPEDDGIWDYVALGDCVFGGEGAGFGKSYPNVFAAYIAEDLGLEVNLHNRCAFAETTVSLLGKLQGDETMRDEVGQAEVVTVWVGALDIFALIYGNYQGEEAPKCGPLDAMDMDCMLEAMQVQEQNLDAILGEIASLRGPDEALIRMADGCDAWVEYLQDAGAFERLNEPVLAHWTGAIQAAAAKHGVTVVPTHAACNGPDGAGPIPAIYRDPNPTRWYYLNAAGHAMIADLHREAGYAHGP